jgi:signal transduction histidine kinase
MALNEIESASFRVNARTLLQLGAELISSDGIAFYELIKNAFDARSPSVRLDVIHRVPQPVLDDAVEQVRRALGKAGTRVQWKKYVREDSSLRESLERVWAEARVPTNSDPTLDTLAEQTSSLEELLAVLLDGNFIEISDTGEGMSREILRDVFLTIGTTFRAKQREASDNSHPILGEKGLGRLSTMRLGLRLRVLTTRAGDRRWHELEVDWTQFAGLTNTPIEGIPVLLREGEEKKSRDAQGTTIHISSLTAEWSKDRLLEIVEHEFNRLSDPFKRSAYPIKPRFNGEFLKIPKFSGLLFDHTHGQIKATFLPIDPDHRSKGMRLTFDFVYTHPENKRTYRKQLKLEGVHLLSASDAPSAKVLVRLGPWALTVYWFNRKYLERIEGIGDLRQVRRLIKEWSGGVMVYRDGFRVNPYGGPDDDWLSVDRDAFASTGFKLNRQQIIGKLDITSTANPMLVDQTSREGLRETPEKEALVALLRWGLERFRSFLNETDKQVKFADNPTLADVRTRLESESIRLNEAWKQLRKAVPTLEEDDSTIVAMRKVVSEIAALVDASKQVAAAYERGHGELLHLASVGLTVDIIAHELTRATTGALKLVSDAVNIGPQSDPRAAFPVLEAQLKTLAKRLRVLDPLSTAGRQRKEVFDLPSWIETILEYHEAQFERHGINCTFKVVPAEQRSYRVRMVKGMIVQILENLISNSVYWLDREARSQESSFKKVIKIRLFTSKGELRFTDNGPGIDPDRADQIFIPFNSTKPSRLGKGLGLYVSREVAEYNGATLSIDRTPDESGMLRTFVLRLPEEAV